MCGAESARSFTFVFRPSLTGYLHIGHTKAICLNFGIAREFGGLCNVRMDDTNPAKEEVVDSIMADVRWLIAFRQRKPFCLGAKPSRLNREGPAERG